MLTWLFNCPSSVFFQFLAKVSLPVRFPQKSSINVNRPSTEYSPTSVRQLPSPFVLTMCYHTLRYWMYLLPVFLLLLTSGGGGEGR